MQFRAGRIRAESSAVPAPTIADKVARNGCVASLPHMAVIKIHPQYDDLLFRQPDS
jgi:hypothetical protein